MVKKLVDLRGQGGAPSPYRMALTSEQQAAIQEAIETEYFLNEWKEPNNEE